MHCQLDELKIIFDIAASARDALRKGFPGGLAVEDFARRAANITCGLLLLKNYDAFIQRGIINSSGKKSPHHWVELYLSGDAFVLDAVLPLFMKNAGVQETDVIFLPLDDAAALYGYGAGSDYDWRREECEEFVWETVLEMLNIKKQPGDIMEEIEDIII